MERGLISRDWQPYGYGSLGGREACETAHELLYDANETHAA